MKLSLFRFVQVELPWSLGPPDGRYLVRSPGASEATHVIVFATLGAPERRRLAARRSRPAAPGPPPTPVATGRATVIDAEPVGDPQAASGWLRGAGEAELEAGLLVLNRALQAYRVASADPRLHTIDRRQALVARVGFGAGEQVADGDWTEARELAAPREPAASREPAGPGARRGRRRALAPQARLAAMLGGHSDALACEELALRARSDLDEGRPREAALQLLAALDAALAELPRDPAAAAIGERIAELEQARGAVAGAAGAALQTAGWDGEPEVASALHRLEAALRARAAASVG